MFCRREVKKLSTHRTSSPRASSRSHRCDPMNPAPPVIRIRFIAPLPGFIVFQYAPDGADTVGDGVLA